MATVVIAVEARATSVAATARLDGNEKCKIKNAKREDERFALCFPFLHFTFLILHFLCMLDCLDELG